MDAAKVAELIALSRAKRHLARIARIRMMSLCERLELYIERTKCDRR